MAKYQDKVHAKQFDNDWLGLKKQPLDVFVAVVVVDAVVFVVVAVVVVMADIIKLTLFLMLFLNTVVIKLGKRYPTYVKCKKTIPQICDCHV